MGHFVQTVGGILQSIFTVIVIVEIIIGNLGNAFLALVNFIDWIKRRKISSIKKILTALAVSRIILLWLLFISSLISLLHPALIRTRTMIRMIHNTWTVGNHFSCWLATCLSIFYFLKIANFSNSTFLYLKWRVKKTVLVTMLVSLGLLSLNILLINKNINVWIVGSRSNITYNSNTSNIVELYRCVLSIQTTFLSVPFGVSLSTFLLLIFSLRKHQRTMKQHSNGSRDVGASAHIKALRITITFLLLHATFFLSFMVQIWDSELLKKDLFTLFCQVVAIAFPSLHSCVLILSDPKLRQVSLSVLWWLRCTWKDAEASHF